MTHSELSKGVAVIGASGHAKVVVATLRAAGFEVLGAFDDDPEKLGTSILGVPVVGLPADVADGQAAVLAIGMNRSRWDLNRRLERLQWQTVVHPSAVVHPSVRVGSGTVVCAGVVIQPDTTVGSHVIVNTSASIDHDCVVGDFAHIAPGVHLAGGVAVGEGAFMGIASVVIPGSRVGKWSIVGAGGVVVGEVEAHSQVAGVPARELAEHLGK